MLRCVANLRRGRRGVSRGRTAAVVAWGSKQPSHESGWATARSVPSHTKSGMVRVSMVKMVAAAPQGVDPRLTHIGGVAR